MKKTVLISAMGVLAAWGATANAQEVGRVISSTPVIQQVAVQRQVCSTQPMAVQQPNSGGGAVLGAIVGGLVGNQFGHGSGRAAATGLGVVGGAALGNNIEGSRNSVQNVQQCSPQTSYENRTVGYNVVYEYGGKQYTVQMPNDPGPTIRLQVTPVGQAPAQEPPTTAAAPSGEPGTPVGVIVGTPDVAPAVYPAYPAYAYPAYYPRYYAPPVSLSLGFGFYGGHHHRHHGHWR
jgi:uncharacterized protein YcfJ